MAGDQADRGTGVYPFDLDGDALSLREWAARTNARLPKRGRQTTGGVVASQRGNWLDRSPTARAIVGAGADVAGLVPGFARGVWHTAQDVNDAVQFYSRLKDPVDALMSPPGEAAWEQALSAAKDFSDYARNARAHPKAVVDEVKGGLRNFGTSLNPFVSRPTDTLWDLAARNFNAGLNQGEAVFDGVSLFGGVGEVRALAGLGKLSKEAQIAKYIARGYPANVAKRFAEPYEGMGSHFWARSRDLPDWLGGGRLPRAISDSPFNVLKPRNISTGDMYELHFGVDPQYYGGKIGKDFRPGPARWSGRELGWTKRGRAGRLWYGSPKPLKLVVGGGIFGSSGALVDQVWNGEVQR